MAENDKENNIPVQELEDGSAKVALELEKDPFEDKPEEKAEGGEVKAARHTEPEAEIEGVTATEAMAEILKDIPVPR